MSHFFGLILRVFKACKILNLVRNFAHFIVYSNLYVAFCAFSLSVFSLQALQFKHETILLAFIFSATLFAYNFQRRISLFDKKKPAISMQDQWILNNKALSNFITIASFIACLYFLYYLPHDSLLLIAPLALISLLYVLKIGKQPALRNIPFLKVFIVAFVWGGAMVLLPTLYFTDDLYSIFSLKAQSLSFALSLFIFGLSLPFDIRDISDDNIAQLKTIPAKMGVKKTILICWLSFLLSSIVFLVCFTHQFISFEIFASLQITIAVSAFMVYLTKKPKHHLFYGLLLEGCLLLPLIVYSFLRF